MTDTPLPFTAFDTTPLGRDSFEAWRQIMAPMFDMAPVGPPQGFAGTVRAWHLGSMVMGGHCSGQVRFTRDSRSLANGIDHYLVQFYRRGGFQCAIDGAEMAVAAGDISLLDLGRPLDGVAIPSDAVSVVIPREVLDERLSASAGLHGLVLKGQETLGGLLADYLASLSSRIHRLTTEEAPLVADSTLNLIAACFQPGAEAAARARPALALAAVERIKRHIEANLQSPDLSPDSICAAFRMSRTHLYRLFAPAGSVARYIQSRRLRKAFEALADPRQRGKKLVQIAHEWGFTSEAHFGRAFRAAFGMTPGEARVQAALLHQSAQAGPVTPQVVLGEWVDRLGRS